jgi:uncharacterized protein YmfQ (DUF2313 family)
MPITGSLAYPLGVPPSGLSSDQVLDLLVQLLPVGASRWYGIRNKVGDVYNFYAATADALKAFWYDGIAILRGEINPATTAYKLPEWEAALGLSQTPIALSGNTVLRRLQIVSKLREQGAFTVSNIQGIIAPLLGYSSASALAVVEANRAALTAAHTYANSTGATLGALGSTTQTVYVPDDGGVSDAGLQLRVVLTGSNPEQVSFTLTGPSGAAPPVAATGNATGTGQAVVTFPAGSLAAGAVTSKSFWLPDASVSPGKYLFGTWSLQVTAGAAGVTLVSWSLFVEGGGKRDRAGNSGLGEQMHDWGVQVNPNLVNSPNVPAAKAALQRVQPADSNAYFVVGTTAKCGPTLYGPFVSNTV